MLYTLGLLGIVQCALVAMAMGFVIERWHLSHKLLLLAICCIGVNFLRGVWLQSGLIMTTTTWVILTVLVGLSILPILHLFLSSLVNPRFKLHWLNALHFLPHGLATLYCLWILPDIPQKPIERLMDLGLFEVIEMTNGEVKVVLILTGAQLFGYFYLNQALLKRNKDRARHYAYVWARRVHWLITLMAFVFSLLMIATILRVDVPVSVAAVISLTFRLLFFLLGFVWSLMLLKRALSAKRPPAAEGDAPSEATPLIPVDVDIDPQVVSKKYTKSGISKARMEILHERVMKALQQEKLYLDNELTLASLAARISCSGHHLSQVLNTMESRSFNEVLNCLRIEEAKTQLIHFPDKTVTDIAMDSGFNSKSSFYALFKKATGQTPGAFKVKATGQV